MQDGVLENFTAGVLEPHLDRRGEPTANRGISFVDPEALKGDVARLDAAGFQVHVHAIGGACGTLGVVANAQPVGPSTARRWMS